MAAIYQFDSVGGSDTQASGYAQDATLAVTPAHGTQATYTEVTGYFSVSLDYPGTLPNIQVGDKIWIQTGSGRQWFTVGDDEDYAKDGNLVVNESLGGSNLTGLTWGCGGSRKTVAGSLQLFADVEAGEKILGQPLSTSAQTQTLTGTISITAAGNTTNGPITFDGNGVTLTSATTSVDLITLSTGYNYWVIQNCHFTHTGATRGNAINDTITTTRNIIIRNCTSNGCLRGLNFGHGGATPQIDNFEVYNSTLSSSTDGTMNFSSNTPWLLNCRVHDNANCCGVVAPSAATCVLDSTVITGNGHDGLRLASGTSALNVQVSGSTIVANGGNNVTVTSTTPGLIALYDNIIFGAGGYNVSFSASMATVEASTPIAYNAVGGATSGNYNNFQGGVGPLPDVAIDSSYFMDYAGGDYRINPAKVSGLLVGYPQIVNGQASLMTMGAEQLQPASTSSSSVGSLIRPLI